MSIHHNLKENEAVLLHNARLINWLTKMDDKVVIIWDQNGHIIFLSPSFDTLFEMDHKKWIGEKWYTIIQENHVEIIENHFMESKDELVLQNIKVKCDETSDYIFRGVFDRIDIGGQKYYIAKFQNISRKFNLEKSLVDSHKLIMAGQLAAGFVHEIRNPLTSIKGFLQLVQSGIKQREEYYKVIIGEIEKIEEITSQLLVTAKPFSHQHRDTERIYSMIQDVTYLFSTHTQAINLQFNINVDKNIAVSCNRSQIKQVLINIIQNGAEAMDYDGTIYIKSEEEDGFVIINITDEGPGIPETMMKDIKNPFFTTKEQGTGLGLMISNLILEQHKGELRAHSSPDKKGSTFQIFLPTG